MLSRGPGWEEFRTARSSTLSRMVRGVLAGIGAGRGGAGHVGLDPRDGPSERCRLELVPRVGLLGLSRVLLFDGFPRGVVVHETPFFRLDPITYRSAKTMPLLENKAIEYGENKKPPCGDFFNFIYFSICFFRSFCERR